MTADELNAIRTKNEQWREGFVNDWHCQECGAGQDGHPRPTDFDSLFAEIDRLKDNFDYLSLRCEGVHNRLIELGSPCETFCVEYADKQKEEIALGRRKQ